MELGLMWLYLVSAWLMLLACGGTQCGPGKDDHQQDCRNPAPNSSAHSQPGVKVIRKSFGAGTQKTHFTLTVSIPVSL